MSDKIEQAKGLFSFIKGELKDVIGAFLTGFVLSGAIIGYYSYERTNIFKDRILELSRDIADNEKQIEFLQQTIITSDKDCANRFIMMSEAIHEIKTGVSNTSKEKDKLSKEKEKHNQELNSINKKIDKQ